MEGIRDLLEQQFLGNAIMAYIIAVLVFLASCIAIKIFRFFILRRLMEWAKKTTTTIDDFLVGVIQKIFLPLSYLAVFYLCANTLTLHDSVKRIIDIFSIAVLTIFTARLATILTNYGVNIYLAKRGSDKALKRSMTGMLRIAKVIIWGLAIVFFLDNMGFKISAVIAGLGVGGIAVALAAQALLGDLFSYFSILFDRPFEIGDFIIVNDFLGTIEYIGIKTTRIRSLGGEQLIFSNTDLTNSRVRNYKRMDKRRVVFKLGVTYQTKLEQLKQIPGIIENIIKNVNDTVFDRAHFSEYGDFNLVIEVVYYVLSRDYNKYMDTQQQINFAIKKEFEAKGIEFAYPTQTLHISREN